MQDIVSRLEQQLSDDISRIHLTDNNVASRHAVQRLKAVAEHAPALLAVLAEPWLDGPVSERTQQLLLDCTSRQAFDFTEYFFQYKTWWHYPFSGANI